MHNKDIVGKEVVSSDGFSVGRVTNLIVNGDSWAITSLEVSPSGGDAGAGTSGRFSGASGILRSPPSSTGENLVTIPVEQVQGVLDEVTLKLSKEQILGTSPSESEREMEERPEKGPPTMETTPRP